MVLVASGAAVTRRWGRGPERVRCALCGSWLPRSSVELDGAVWVCRDPDACRLRAVQPTLDQGPPAERLTEVRQRSRCPHPRRMLGYAMVAAEGPGAAGRVTPLRVAESYSACRSWTCEHCSRGRRIEVRRHLSGALADQGRRYRFITLTFAEDLRLDRVEDLREARRRRSEWVREIRRIFGREFEYGEVGEPTKHGRIHLHALTATPTSWPKLPKCRGRKGEAFACACPDRVESRLPYRGPCIQKLAHRAGIGWVDIRVVRSPKAAAGYVTKYLTKDAVTSTPWPKGARRYTYSRRWHPGVTIGGLRVAYALEVAERMARAEGRQWPPPPPPQPVEWWSYSPPPQLPPVRGVVGVPDGSPTRCPTLG